MRLPVLIALSLVFFSLSPVHAADTNIREKPYRGSLEIISDRTHLDINADATYTETVSFTAKILDKTALERMREQNITFAKSLSDVVILSAATMKASGKVLPVPKENYQVESGSGESGAKPMISDLVTKTIIFPNLEVNDTISLSYRFVQREATYAGQFSDEAAFSREAIVDQSEFSVTAPASLPLRVESHDVDGGATKAPVGYHSWVWHFQNHTLAVPQSASEVDALEYAPHILVSTYSDYGALAHAYDLRARPQAIVTPRVKNLANEITQHTTTKLQTVEALYTWVAKHIAYEYNLVGVGAVVPHDTDHILDNKIGDCKDHALLLQTLLAAKGIQSTASLIDTGTTYHLPNLPILNRFDHVITYIPSLKLYLDSTNQPLPLGVLPIHESGKPTIHISPFDGISYTPPSDILDNTSQTVAETTYHEDGSADGTISSTFRGEAAADLRSTMGMLETSPYRSTIVKKLLEKSGLRGYGSYTYDNTNVNTNLYHTQVKFHIDNALDLSGPGALGFFPPVLGQDVPISAFMLRTASSDRPEHGFLCLSAADTITVIAHLPKTLRVLALPATLHLSGPHQTYDSTYTQDGNIVTSKRNIMITVPSNVCESTDYDDMKSQDTAILKDLKKQLLFTTSSP